MLHVASDTSLTNERFGIVEERSGDIYTVWAYYRKVKTRFPFISHWIKRRRLLQAYDRGYEILLRNAGSPDLIQLNVAMPAGIGVMHLSKKHSLPFVLNEGWTGYMPADGSYRGFFLKWFTKKIVSAARLIMPVSEALEEAMKHHGLNGNYKIVPNVVNTRNFGIISAANDNGALKLIHISTLDQRQKNVSGIINAVEKALQNNVALRLTLVGDGDDKRMLEEQVKQQGLGDFISFKGVMLKEEIVKEIQAHDALIMFSNYESFCVVIAEAMACGKPVISSRCGGLTSLITDDLGYTVEPGDETALAKAILQLNTNKNRFEPAAIRKFVTGHFDQDVIARKLNEVYNSVL